MKDQISIFEERSKGIQDAYLKMIGEHLKRIGSLLPSDVNRLIEMRRLDRNLSDIRLQIAKAAKLNEDQVNMAFLQYGLLNYSHAVELLGVDDPPPVYQNEQLLQLIRAQARVTAGSMRNLSNTTIESTLYRRSVDTAIQAVQTGQTDYNSAVRMAASHIAREGLVITYPTGYHRRLDSAVRQNVLDGARALNQAVLDEVGAEFNANGVELSAHAMCAADHLPYQGRQYRLEEFEQLQQDLSQAPDGHHRPIGMWNCRHIARPIILGVSKPAYSEEMLKRFKENSEKKITIGDKTLTRYEWTQEQRKYETEIRRQRDLITLSSARGDTVAVKNAQSAIKTLQDQYAYISKAAGLETKFDRTLSRTTGVNNVPNIR